MTDRWCELDVAVFDPARSTEEARLVIGALSPLLRGGDAGGLMLCCGWLTDLALLFSGDPEQPLPWTSRRLQRWHGRSYRDLATLVAALRTAAIAEDLPWLRIGWLCVGMGTFAFPAHHDLYDFHGRFIERHPECCAAATGREYDARPIDVSAQLQADEHVYAAFPRGLPPGLAWHQVFARQWAALAAAVGFDAILLRDHLPGGSSPEEGTRRGVALAAALKTERPQALVLGYSGGRGSHDELDLGAVAAHLDTWVTQSWGGAWQDWWNSASSGWTFQLAAILGDRAALHRAGGTCRHVHLIETVDAFEPWDTIHAHRGKLAWGIQAFAHAVSRAADGRLRPGDGVYVSWLSDRHGRLLPPEDLRWLADELDQADASVRGLEAVHGVALAPAAELPTGLSREQAGAWLHDQAGWLMKWGLPILAEGVAGAEAVMCALPAELPEPARPCLVAGRADLLARPVRQACGLETQDERQVGGFAQVSGPGIGGWALSNLPTRPAVHAAEPLLRADGEAVLAAGPGGLWWQPPLRHAKTGMIVPNLLGTCDLFCAVAAAFSARLPGPRLAPAAVHEPVAFSAWTSGGRLHLLLGNLESGHVADARHARPATLLGLPPGACFEDADDAGRHQVADDGSLRLVVPPEGRLLLREIPKDPVVAGGTRS